MCFPSVPTRYWAVWWEWTVNQEPLGSGKFRPHLMPSPLPWLLQPREYFIPTPLRCDAVTVSARTGLLRHEQLISKDRGWGNKPPCQVKQQEEQEPFILLYSLCSSFRNIAALLSTLPPFLQLSLPLILFILFQCSFSLFSFPTLDLCFLSFIHSTICWLLCGTQQ